MKQRSHSALLLSQISVLYCLLIFCLSIYFPTANSLPNIGCMAQHHNKIHRIDIDYSARAPINKLADSGVIFEYKDIVVCTFNFSPE